MNKKPSAQRRGAGGGPNTPVVSSASSSRAKLHYVLITILALSGIIFYTFPALEVLLELEPDKMHRLEALIRYGEADGGDIYMPLLAIFTVLITFLVRISGSWY